MLMPMPTVAVCHSAPDPYLPLLADAIPADRLRVCRAPEAITDGAADAEVVLAFKFGGRPFPREAILALPMLRWVQLASAGGDHFLPFDPARLAVTSASGLHGDTMAEYVLATLVHMRWDFDRLRAQQAARRWQCYDVPPLRGATMGVIGAGHVGGRIARLARTAGMRTLGVRRAVVGATADPGLDPGGDLRPS
jgi:phosphoglycerate dehydrogenase-like enzyme